MKLSLYLRHIFLCLITAKISMISVVLIIDYNIMSLKLSHGSISIVLHQELFTCLPTLLTRRITHLKII